MSTQKTSLVVLALLLFAALARAPVAVPQTSPQSTQGVGGGSSPVTPAVEPSASPRAAQGAPASSDLTVICSPSSVGPGSTTHCTLSVALAPGGSTPTGAVYWSDSQQGSFSYTMYGCDNGDEASSLYAIDPATGDATPIGSMGVVYGCVGLTFSNDGTLYAIGYTAHEARAAFRVDVSTGAATFIAEVSLPGECPSLTGFAASPVDGTLYATFGPCFAEISPTTGASTSIGSTSYGWSYGNALAFSPNGVLYAATTSGLYTLDPTSAASAEATSLRGYPNGCGPTQSVMESLAFDDGQLYGVLYCYFSYAYHLVSIDPTTGAETVIGSSYESLDAIGAGSYCDLSSGACSVSYTAPSAPLLYGCDYVESSSLYAVNPATGETTRIGPMGMSSCSAVVFGSTGTLYAFGYDDDGSAALYTVNLQTGAATEVGTTSEVEGCYDDWISLAMDPTSQALYGALDNCIVSLSSSDGASTLLGSTDFDAEDYGSALAFSPNGVLYAASDALYTVDPTTGTDAMVADFTGYPAGCEASDSYVSGLGFNGGVLYGVLVCYGGDDPTYLVTIDPATAAMTVMGETLDALSAVAWIPSCSLASTSCPATASPVKITITAQYDGDSNYGPSSGTFLLNGVSSPVTVLCSPSSVDTGSPTKCTVTVKGSSPTGTVTFSSSSSTGSFVPSGGACTLSLGSCQVSYSDATAGQVVITANYGGDSNNNPSSGGSTLTVTVPKSASSTVVTCGPSSIALGSATPCTATVTGKTPTGTVSWSTSGNGYFNETSCALSSAACSVLYTPQDAGSPVKINASYGGNAGNTPSSGTFSVAVTKEATSLSVSCTPSTFTMSGLTTCTASVSYPISPPTGQVTFTTSSSNGGAVAPSSASCTLSGSGCSVTFGGVSNGAGTVTVTAAYAGDSNNLGSSNTFSLTIIKNPTSTDVNCVPASLNPGGVSTCTASVLSSFSLPSAKGPIAAAYDPQNGYVYVVNEGYPDGGDTVSVLNGATGALVTTVYAGPTPYDVAYDPSNGLVYVADSGAGSGDTVAVINASTNQFVQYIVVGSAPSGIVYDSGNKLLYVANYWDDTVSVINGTSNSVLGLIQLQCQEVTGCGPTGMAYDPHNGYIYVANQRSYPGTISVINGQTNGRVATIGWVYGKNSFAAPTAIAYDPQNGYLYAVSYDDTSVYAISPASNSTYTNLVYVHTGFSNYDGVAYDSSNGDVYAVSSSGTVVVIDGSTFSVTGAVPVGLGAQGIAIDSSNDYLYVTNWIAGTISVIEPGTGLGGEQIAFSQAGGTGSVSFGSSSCSLSSTGTCSVQVTAVNPGGVSIEASFAGDSNYSPSSGTFILSILTQTSTSVVCTPPSVNSGSPSTCKATVTGGSPTGAVSFTAPGAGTFSPTSCTLSGGTCSVTYTPTSSSSPVKITASYGGDAVNDPSSGTFSLTVTTTTTTTTTTSSSSSSGSSCACTYQSAFVDPTTSNPSTSVATGTYPSPDGSTKVVITTISGTFYLSVTKGTNTLVSSQIDPIAWAWSPNGDYLVLAQHTANQQSNQVSISVFDLDGSSPSTATISQPNLNLGAGGSEGYSLTYGSGGWTWGFSPDSATFVLFYVDQQGTIQIKLWAASSGSVLVQDPLVQINAPSGSYTPSAVIQFSPCSDLLMVAEEPSPSSPHQGTATFYETWVSGSVAYKSVDIVTVPIDVSTGKDGSGNYVVQLTGTNPASFPSPQCTNGCTTTTTTTTTSSSSEGESGGTPSKTTVDCTPSPVDKDSYAICTATVTDAAGGGATPTGSINWDSTKGGNFDDASCDLLSGSCSVTFSPDGDSSSVTITASYVPGESSDYNESEGTYQLSVTLPNPSHTVVSCTLNSDSTFTCMATVTGNDPSVPPSGEVDWDTGAGDQGGFSQDTCELFTGWCSVIFTPSVSGQITVTGDYGGDSHNSESSGSTTVLATATTTTSTESSASNREATQTSVTCTPDTIDTHSTAQCTVTVTGNNPTGEIWISINGASYSGGDWTCLADSLCQRTISPYESSTSANFSAAFKGDAKNAPSSAFFIVTITGGTNSTESSSETSTTESGNPCDAPDSNCDMNETTDPAYVLLTDVNTGHQAGCNAVGSVVDTIPGATVTNLNSSAPSACSGGTERIVIPSPISGAYDLEVFAVGPSSPFVITFVLTDSSGGQLGSTTYSGTVTPGSPESWVLSVGAGGGLQLSSGGAGTTGVPEFPALLGQAFFLLVIAALVPAILAIRRRHLRRLGGI